MSHTEPNLPPDLLEIARTLDAEGPRMTECERARVRRTALQRATAARRRPAGPRTRSRLAITSMLAVGALMSSGGAALGVSALSTDLSARAAQYGTSPQQSTQQTLAPPGDQSGTAAGTGAGSAPAGGAGELADGGPAGATATEQGAAAEAQAARQLEVAGGSELPFTGYVAIPLLLMGLGLLAAGVMLRRSGRATSAQP